MGNLHVEVHHLVQVERIDAPGDRHAQRVADEVPGVMVLEKLWILGKYRALVRLFDIGLNRQQSVLSRLVQELVAHLQRFQVERLGEVRTLQASNHPGNDLLDHLQRVRDQQGTQRRSSDDDQLRRLHQNLEVPVLHQVAGDNRAEHHHNANDDEHRFTLSCPCCSSIPSPILQSAHPRSAMGPDGAPPRASPPRPGLPTTSRRTMNPRLASCDCSAASVAASHSGIDHDQPPIVPAANVVARRQQAGNRLGQHAQRLVKHGRAAVLQDRVMF